MRRAPRVLDLVTAVAAVDLVLAVVAATAARTAWLAAPIALIATALLIVYARSGGRARTYAVLGLVVALAVIPEAALIYSHPPHAPISDALLATEAAARRLLAGLDPYGHDYVDDAALRAFLAPELPVNPLLAHYVYPPGAILSAVPFAAAGLDYAWLWPPALLALALAALYAGGRGAVAATALNPLVLLDSYSLFSDLLWLACGLLAVGLASRRRPLAAGVALAAAILLKQQALVLAPVLLLAFPGRLRLLAGAAVCGLAVGLPFLLWSPASFLADTLAYFYGSGLDSFPIRGFGVPGLLLAAGWLSSRWAAFPAAAAQLPVLAVVLVMAWRDLRAGRGGWPRFWLWSAAVAAVLFLFGRTLAPNYLTVVVVLLGLALASALGDPPPGRTDQQLAPGERGVEVGPAAGEGDNLPPVEGAA